MKKLIFIPACFTFVTVFSQSEFKTYKNGLIYSEETMKQLSKTADSLNLKFKTCDPNPQYNAIQQAKGYLVVLKEGRIGEAAADINAEIKWEDFVTKYPDATIRKDILVIKHKYINHKNENIVELEEFDPADGYGVSIESNDINQYTNTFKGKWFMEETEKEVIAFYFPDGFIAQQIPQKYALMIGYSDCMVDTTTAKMLEEKSYGRLDEDDKPWKKMSQAEKLKELDKLRSTRVYGFCSQDDSPRIHAMNIAKLSADVNKWEVFLKAHLDIMNDRFDRMSDGSYAWGRRQTYIRELEELNINVTDLLFGTVFRINNPAKHHYFASISRVGRALSETKNRKEVEDGMYAIITDTTVDDYNRTLFYYLYRNYNYYLEDEKLKEGNKKKLAEAKETLPAYLKNSIKEEK